MICRRRAYSLVEVLVVMTSSSLIMGLGVNLIAMTMRHGAVAETCRDAQRSASRLSRQLRIDVAFSRSAELDDGGTQLRLAATSSRTIEWRAAGRRFTREEMEGDEVRRREVYEFPTGSKAAFAAIEAPLGVVANVSQRLRAQTGFDGPIVRIEAFAGSWSPLGFREEQQP